MGFTTHIISNNERSYDHETVFKHKNAKMDQYLTLRALFIESQSNSRFALVFLYCTL